jgi:GAF domain-containing protein
VARATETDRIKLANERSEDDSGSLQRPSTPHGRGGGAKWPSAFAAVAELGRRLLSFRAVIVVIEGNASASTVAFDPKDALIARASMDARALADPVAVGEIGLRFYAGIPLYGASGQNLGILAAVDGGPRELSDEELESLKLAARIAIGLIESGEDGEPIGEEPTSV